jgi:type VI secretion system secreted protein VgrG
MPAHREMMVIAPVGGDPKDAMELWLLELNGREGISQLFDFQLEVKAPNSKKVPFQKLLGQKLTVSFPKGTNTKGRFVNGIISRMSQGESDTRYTRYRLELVPQFWLLTRNTQSRIFHQESVPAILKKVLKGISTDFTNVKEAAYHPRDYCVQYRETDFNFASRLMEEEGIYYYFEHSAADHKMVLSDKPLSHPALPAGPQLQYKKSGALIEEDRVLGWQKTQEVRAGKYTLWDHCFELAHDHLEANQLMRDQVMVGKAPHQLVLGPNKNLEIYEFPGEYAQRFDGVDPGGADRPKDVEKIFNRDNKRTVEIRMEQEAATSLLTLGTSNCRHLASGYQFTLDTSKVKEDKPLDADGDYLLVTIGHSARYASKLSEGPEQWGGFVYQNTFTCIPAGLAYRPPRTALKPIVPGTQTAVVIGSGSPKEEIFTDKYGRVKVKFHWDRDPKKDAMTSCWIRVAQIVAGKRWGTSFWPRIGQEVVVSFLEGDPDQPLIVGSVYNSDQMPPYLGKGFDNKHSDDNKVSGIKTNTTLGGVGFNELRFDDTEGAQQIFMHAENNMDVRVKHDSMERVIHDRHLIVGAEKDGQKSGDQRELVHLDKHLHVKHDHIEHIENNMELLVGTKDGGGDQDIVIKKDKKELVEGELHFHVKKDRFEEVNETMNLTVDKDRRELISGNSHHHVKKNRSESVEGMQSLSVGGEQREQIAGDIHIHGKGDRNEKVDGTQSLTIGSNQQEKVGQNHALEAGMEIHLKAGMKVIIEAGVQLSLVGPGGFVDIGPAGVTIQGTLVMINSGGAAGSGSGSSPTAPQDPAGQIDPKLPQSPKEADPKVPAEADDSKTGHKSAPDATNGAAKK